MIAGLTMEKSSNKTVALIILAASSIPLLVDTHPLIRIPAALIQAFFLPGMVAVSLFGKKGRPWLDDLMLAPVVSPIVMTFMLAAVRLITGYADSSLTITIWILYASLALVFLLRSSGVCAGEGGAPHFSGRILAISALLPAVIFIAYSINHTLLLRSDAWMHASIVNEILERGFPPLEPRLPDVPIRYMWFYHLFQASWTSLSGLDVFWAMGVSNIVNAFIFPWIIFRLTALFTKERRRLIFTPLFALAGLQSASWVLWPLVLVRMLAGEVTGIDELRRILSTVDINSHRVIFSLSPYYTFPVNPIDKFFTTTTFNYVINLFLLAIMTAAGAAESGPSCLRTAAAVFLLAFGAFLFHVVTGLVLIIVICGAGIYMFIAGRIARGKNGEYFRQFGIPAAAILAGAAGIPYFLSLTSGVGGVQKSLFDYLHIGLMSMATIAAPLLVLFPFARRALARLFTGREAPFRFAAGAVAALVAINLFVDLPGEVEGKFAFILFLLLVLFVAGEIIDWFSSSRGAHRVWAAAVLAALFAFPAFLTIRGFILDRPRGIEKILMTADPGQTELFEWLRGSTDIDAVIIEKNDYGFMPVYAHRHEFAMPENFRLIQGYGGDRVVRYERMRGELYEKASLGEDDIGFLRKLGRELYLVLWNEDLEADPGIIGRFESNSKLFERVFTNRSGIVYRLALD